MGCDCFTGVSNFILISQAVYELSGFETLKIGHTHTHTSGRQLKITFLDVLDYFKGHYGPLKKSEKLKHVLKKRYGPVRT